MILSSNWNELDLALKRDRETKRQRDRGTQRQRDTETKGQGDRGTNR